MGGGEVLFAAPCHSLPLPCPVHAQLHPVLPSQPALSCHSLSCPALPFPRLITSDQAVPAHACEFLSCPVFDAVVSLAG